MLCTIGNGLGQHKQKPLKDVPLVHPVTGFDTHVLYSHVNEATIEIGQSNNFYSDLTDLANLVYWAAHTSQEYTYYSCASAHTHMTN